MPRYPGVTADKLRRERSLITALLVGAVDDPRAQDVCPGLAAQPFDHLAVWTHFRDLAVEHSRGGRDRRTSAFAAPVVEGYHPVRHLDGVHEGAREVVLLGP